MIESPGEKLKVSLKLYHGYTFYTHVFHNYFPSTYTCIIYVRDDFSKSEPKTPT